MEIRRPDFGDMTRYSLAEHKATSNSEILRIINDIEPQENDLLMLDVDGTLRPTCERMGPGIIRGLQQRQIYRYLVSVGLGFRFPDSVNEDLLAECRNFNCYRAVVTDNTVGGHWVSSFVSRLFNYETWMNVARRYEYDIFSVDTNKSGLKALETRLWYFTKLIVELIMERTITKPYKGTDGHGGLDIVCQYALSLGQGNKIIMVGDSPRDLDFLKRLGEVAFSFHHLPSSLHYINRCVGNEK